MNLVSVFFNLNSKLKPKTNKKSVQVQNVSTDPTAYSRAVVSVFLYERTVARYHDGPWAAARWGSLGANGAGVLVPTVAHARRHPVRIL